MRTREALKTLMDELIGDSGYLGPRLETVLEYMYQDTLSTCAARSAGASGCYPQELQILRKEFGETAIAL